MLVDIKFGIFALAMVMFVVARESSLGGPYLNEYIMTITPRLTQVPPTG